MVAIFDLPDLSKPRKPSENLRETKIRKPVCYQISGRNVDTEFMIHDTSLTPANSPQTWWSPGRCWHAEVEFEVENIEIPRPDLEN